MSNTIRRLAAGVWTQEYGFRDYKLNTLIVDIGQGRLAVFSPGIGLTDAGFAAVDELGKVAALVSPGAFHNMGLTGWHARYPEARLFGTASGLAHIAKKHPTLPALEPMAKLSELAGDALVLHETPGKKHSDLLVFVPQSDGVTLFSNEYLVNWEVGPKNFVFRMIFKWTDSAPGLRLAKPSAWFLGADLKEVAGFCRDKIQAHGATRFVPCHGVIVEGPDTKDRLLEAIQRRL